MTEPKSVLAPATASDAQDFHEKLRREGAIPGPQIRMTVTEWHSIPNHPRQRNTEERANRARHLTHYDPSHQKVHMLVFPDGSRQKGDGHTRDLLWTTGRLEPPEDGLLVVDVWYVADQAASDHLYTTFDSAFAVETMHDRMYGALREQAMTFQSGALKNGSGGSGIDLAYQFLYGGKSDTYNTVSAMRGELLLLDQCAPSRHKFVVPVIAGALICIRWWEMDAVEFLTKFQNDEGEQTGGIMDGVMAFTEKFAYMQAKGQFWGMARRHQIMRMTYTACDAYLSGKTYPVKGGLREVGPKRFEQWLNKVKTKQPLVLNDNGEIVHDE